MAIGLDSPSYGRARQVTRSRWHQFDGAVRPLGWVLLGLGGAQAVSAVVGALAAWSIGRSDWGEVIALGIGAAIGASVGGACLNYARRVPVASLSRREAVLAVALIWIGASVVGGLPFVIGADMSPFDALFETTSGLTTTGATVVTHIERDLARPLLLWRSLIQWLGGMGIVVLMVAVLPTLGAGAKHMFRGEVTGSSAEGLKPRIASTSMTLWKLYAALTGLQTALLLACGIEPFEAVCHAMTTMSTGGFSTRDASVAGFDNAPAEYVFSVFMLVGSVNYGLYYVALKGRSPRALLRSTELRAFVLLVAVAVVAGTASLYTIHDGDLERATRMSLFQVATFVSSTGYVTDDYMAYPPGFLLVLVALMFVGGCSGSTAGGFKVERLVLMAKVAWAETHKAFQPNQVRTIRMGTAAVSPDVLTNVAAFLAVNVAVIVAGVLFLAVADGVALHTAFGAVLTCIANSGPAPYYLDGDNFAVYSGATKVACSLLMLLGRLEMFTLLALFAPSFWRR